MKSPAARLRAALPEAAAVYDNMVGVERFRAALAASPHGARLLDRISHLGDRVAHKSPKAKLGGTPGSLRRRPRM